MSDENLLTEEEILSADDLDYVDVPVPEWTPKGAAKPKCIRLRAMSAADGIKFTEEIGGEARKNGMVKILVACAIKADGSPMFTAQQLEALKKKNIRVFSRLQDEALKLNGFTKNGLPLVKNV